MECVLIKCKDFARLFSTKWVELYGSEVISLMLLRREIMLCRCQKATFHAIIYLAISYPLLFIYACHQSQKEKGG
jgi:hypothetical protein